MAYSGTIYRGIDYSPTWPSWAQGAGGTQTNDSDLANDAFASLWASTYQANTGPSAPVNNGTGAGNYRGDLDTIASNGFNLVRLYNWDMARGTTASSNTGTDHINFLNYAGNEQVKGQSGLGLKVVVPVSDYFIGNDQFSWGSTVPDSSYSFSSAPQAIQTDFTQFVNSITNPATGKIHTAIHSISVGNEADIHTGTEGASASQFLARTIWWIYNLNKAINGTATVSNGSTVLLSATFSNADEGNNTPGNWLGGWFNDLVSGVTASTLTPNGWSTTAGSTFGTAVTGLSTVDPNWATYYYNSVNIAQVSSTSPYSASQLSQTLGYYDTYQPTVSPWPGTQFNVPLMLMEVFNNNRSFYNPTTDQATSYVNQAKAIEAYLLANAATTNLMGYNFFEFNDEPSTGNPQMGLYQYTTTSQSVQTGTTSVFYSPFSFPNASFPVYTLTPTPGPTNSPAGTTLVSAWTAQFAPTHSGTAAADNLVGSDSADRLRAGAGNDKIDGGKGYDIALFDQNAQAYTLKAAAGSTTITVQDKVGTEGTDTLTGIEQIRFANGTIDPAWIVKAASLPAAEILKIVDLYTAGLNRAPDAIGLDYWASQLASGASLREISKVIFSSAEAMPIYSVGNSNPVFVNLAYHMAFGHGSDVGGTAYWVNELDLGHMQRTDLVTALIAAVRAPGGSAADAQYVANKEAVGAHFALTQGLNNIAWARTVEASVNNTAASVTAATAQTDAFAATAATAAGTELVVQIVGIVA